MNSPMVRLGARLGAAALLLAILPLAGHAQTVTGNFRGRVLSTDGSPVVSASVTATNTETGVARSTVTDAQGRYLLLGLSLGNYAVRAQAIGHRPLEKTGLRLQVGAELIVEFSLEPSAIEVTAIPVVVEQVPLVDPTKTGVNTRVSQEQIENLPTNGRNFTDFIGLSPTFVKRPGFGAGAQAGSLGGARDGGVVIQMDGVQNSGTFFGGDPRGSDRLPIAFTIEAVREFQVLTNEYDVSKGGFTGGIVNAVTKSGTNDFHGTFFEYYRGDAEFLGINGLGLTKKDFLGLPPSEFRSHQFGAALSGPVIKNKLHFFGAVDRQARQAPIQGLSPTTTGIADTILARLDSIIRNVYNVDPGQTGTFPTIQNEWVLFGRLDWNLSSRHRLAIRDSYTALDFTGDRISVAGSTRDYSSSGGPLKPKSNSFVVNLFSNLSSSLFNEFRFQHATDKKPRPSAVTYPQVRVVLSGTQGTQNIALGADSIIQFNNLEETTLQFADILTYNKGAHSVQLGTDNTRYDFFNLFFNNGLGTYTFSWGNNRATLDSLAARRASAFTRSVPISGVSPVANPDSIPTADYVAWNYAFFLQDKWQATPRLTVQAGLRLDVPKVNGVPRNNPLLLDSFPQFFLDAAGIARIRGGTGTAADSITTARQVATRYNWAPRVGLVYDVFGDRRTVLRGGAGLFYGYTPFVFWSNMFLNTGRDQLSVACSAAVPAETLAVKNVDLTADAPTSCGAGVQPAANAFFFGQDYKTPYAFKANFGFDHGVTPSLVIGGEFAYAKTYDNYSNRDVNYRTDNPRILTGEGGRIVVGSAPATGSLVRRIDTRFRQVLIHENESRADYVAVIGSVRYRIGAWDLSGSYTYSRNRDDYSRSCCTSTSQYAAIEAGVNTNNNIRANFGASDNDSPHNVVLSALYRAPFGLNVSGIWRTSSGRPYSPQISSAVDANGDGVTGNDNAYIPRDRADITIDGNAGGAGQGTVAQQDSAYAVLDRTINLHACLRTQRGRIAA
ncbi:MAG: TonB-dependent receptor, partial [Gemmatimonadetes bacterium]|nr:TonB-dependent receptor [Gemmatimonadota bacterium]